MQYWTMINPDSRRGGQIDTARLAELVGGGELVPYPTQAVDPVPDDVAGMVVCGGDGTLHRAINGVLPKRLYYVPCGTVNDQRGKAGRLTVGDTPVGRIGYVAAVGTFTRIGYTAKERAKRRWGRLAYWWEAVKDLHVQRIAAKIEAGETRRQGQYTLLMYLMGTKCFGFNFVRDKQHAAYVLAVESPCRGGLWGGVAMLAKFFRLFFVGVRPPYDKHGIWLQPAEDACITLDTSMDWCVDGDRASMNELRVQKKELPVEMIVLRRYR